jgi:hypothetical protein
MMLDDKLVMNVSAEGTRFHQGSCGLAAERLSTRSQRAEYVWCVLSSV